MPSFTTPGSQGIHFEDAGAGVPLLFVHSLGSSGHLWAGQLAAFSGDFRAIAPDLRGHGHSPHAGEMTIAAMADDQVALLDHLGAARAHLVGISMGGVILQEIYDRHPGRVASLTLACTFSRMDPQVAAQRLRDREDYLAGHTMADFAARYVADTLLPATPEAEKEALRQTMGAMDRDAYLAATRACFAADVYHVPPTIAVPTLVMGAELDKGYPPESIRALAARIPGARLGFIPQAAHLAHLDNPPAFHAVLAAFLASIA